MDFDLEKLHWREFEKLIAFYLKEVIGEGITVFSGTHDKGRDAVFEGKANKYPSETNPYSGKWIFQVKHRKTANSTLRAVASELLRTLEVELEKVFVKHSFKCNNYVYITNINLANDFKEQAKTVFSTFCQRKNIKAVSFSTVDYKDIAIYLAKYPIIRHSFPSLLNYTDLEKVFIKKDETRNKGYLKFAFENIQSFVSTSHYRESLERIHNNNFLMLIGNPKSGKTNIIDAIALSFLDEMDFMPYFIRTTEEFFSIASYLTEDGGALFICDDIFGKHDLDKIKLADWTDYFTSVMGLIDPRHKFLFTTRQYIYEQFASRSGLRAFFPIEGDPGRYTIRLSQLSNQEREQILEKHLITSGLASSAVDVALMKKEDILNCKDFSPEVIRSLVTLLSKAPEEELVQVIDRHLAKPNQYLFDFFSNINIAKKLLLISLATAYGPEIEEIERTYYSISQDYQYQTSFLFQDFINELSGSIIKRRDYHEASEIEYYHPSMQDTIMFICKRDKSYRALVLRNPNLEILTLITIVDADEEASLRIQIREDEVSQLGQGLDRLVSNLSVLSEITSIIRWIKLVQGLEVPFAQSFATSFKYLEEVVGSQIASPAFVDRFAGDTLSNWINLFDAWRLNAISLNVSYLNKLEEMFNDPQLYEYWELVFLLEAISQGIIQENVGNEILNEFQSLLSNRVEELNNGLNIIGGKPKTHPGWVPLYLRLESLISRMKASGYGRRILEEESLVHWSRVQQYSAFCKNRHRGMVSEGHWRIQIASSMFTKITEHLTPTLRGVPICPSCQATMVLRKARQGATSGRQFYGCSRFPECKQTLPIH